jgi:hypothetical protein
LVEGLNNPINNILDYRAEKLIGISAEIETKQI